MIRLKFVAYLTAELAGVVISLKYLLTPFLHFSGVPYFFIERGYTTIPVPMLITSVSFIAFIPSTDTIAI